MKSKKLPIFLEITRKSFFVIVLILVIYAIAQLIIFGTFTNDYERDLLTNTYQSLSNLSENVNNDISQKILSISFSCYFIHKFIKSIFIYKIIIWIF